MIPLHEENKLGVMPITKLIWNMSLPIIASMLVQALYNIVDSWFVSRVSEQALTAVSLAFPAQNLMIGLATGTAVGVNALMGRALGAGLRERADKVANNGVFLAVVGFVISALLGLTCSDLFFRSQTQVESIIQMGNDYLRIVTIGSLGMFCQIMYERLLQGTGRSILSMYTQGLGAIINIILDPIFIFNFGMGVKGAALATVISQGISCVWVLSFLTGSKTVLKIKKENFLTGLRFLPPCIALGMSAFVMQGSESVISLCFNSSLLQYGGDLAVGAMTILSSVMQFAMLPLQGIAQGAQPISSYNFGAGNRERVSRTFRLLLRSSLVYSFGLWALVQLFPQLFALMFTSDSELVSYASWALRIYMAATGIFGIQIACQQSFMALGQAKVSLLLACLRKLILLIPLIYILPNFFDDKVFAVFLAEPVADVLAVCTTVTVFLLKFKKTMARMNSAA